MESSNYLFIIFIIIVLGGSGHTNQASVEQSNEETTSPNATRGFSLDIEVQIDSMATVT